MTCHNGGDIPRKLLAEVHETIDIPSGGWFSNPCGYSRFSTTIRDKYSERIHRQMTGHFSLEGIATCQGYKLKRKSKLSCV